MIQLMRAETINQIHEGKKLNYDIYTIEVGTILSTKEVSVVVDYDSEEITGDQIAHGSWYDIDTNDCIAYLKVALLNKEPQRPLEKIFSKYEN